jgi:hypothetical protein
MLIIDIDITAIIAVVMMYSIPRLPCSRRLYTKSPPAPSSPAPAPLASSATRNQPQTSTTEATSGEPSDGHGSTALESGLWENNGLNLVRRPQAIGGTNIHDTPIRGPRPYSTSYHPAAPITHQTHPDPAPAPHYPSIPVPISITQRFAHPGRYDRSVLRLSLTTVTVHTNPSIHPSGPPRLTVVTPTGAWLDNRQEVLLVPASPPPSRKAQPSCSPLCTCSQPISLVRLLFVLCQKHSLSRTQPCALISRGKTYRLVYLDQTVLPPLPPTPCQAALIYRGSGQGCKRPFSRTLSVAHPANVSGA